MIDEEFIREQLKKLNKVLYGTEELMTEEEEERLKKYLEELCEEINKGRRQLKITNK
jgi:hypothetical protein